MNKEVNTTLAQVRKQAAETIMDLRKGKVSPLVADAIYKQSITIVDSYRVELRGITLAIEASENRLNYDTALKVLENNKA